MAAAAGVPQMELGVNSALGLKLVKRSRERVVILHQARRKRPSPPELFVFFAASLPAGHPPAPRAWRPERCGQTFSLQLSHQVNDNSVQPRGVLHGGVSGLIIEQAASEGAYHNIDNSCFFPAGVELNASHLRPAPRGATLVATAVRATCAPPAGPASLFLPPTAPRPTPRFPSRTQPPRPPPLQTPPPPSPTPHPS